MVKSRNIYLIFDKYEKPSIKDYEHVLRGEELKRMYNKKCTKENKRAAEFTKLWRSRNFKDKFVELLIED